MKARPILFSAPMVRALLAGTKTQTRRIVKGAPTGSESYVLGLHAPTSMWGIHADVKRGDGVWRGRCPYGSPGDLLWVRETTIRVEEHGYLGPVYASSEQGMAMRDWGIGPAPDDVRDVEPEDVRLRPAIHMPRKYSRLTLRITQVRVQRLKEIAREDAVAEGLIRLPASGRYVVTQGEQYFGAADRDPRVVYADLWERINGAGAWDANPWVWALTFEVIQQNVDAVLASRGAT